MKIALGEIRRFRNAVYSTKENKKQLAMISQLATDIVVNEQEEAGNTVRFFEVLAGEIWVRFAGIFHNSETRFGIILGSPNYECR